MTKTRLFVAALFVVGVFVYFFYDLGQYFTLAYYKTQYETIAAYYEAHPWRTALYFGILYVPLAALSLPGAALLTLVAGAIFGTWWGTLLVSVGSTIAATLTFYAARFLLRDVVQSRFAASLRSANAGIEKDGALYLFMLRLSPVFPFFIVNVVMALTTIRASTFIWVSQIGMLLGTVVFVNAGTEIAEMDSLSGILSPGLIASLTLLGLFPLITSKTIEFVKVQRLLRRFRKPRHFDYNLIIIGAGSAGRIAADVAGSLRAKAAVIEPRGPTESAMNTRCIPSKALIHTTRLLALARRAPDLGIYGLDPRIDFQRVMRRVCQVSRAAEARDGEAPKYARSVESIAGSAELESPYSVLVDGRRLTSRSILIATGSRPLIPALPGLDRIDYLTSDTVWDLQELPNHLLILGGGAVGCELAQCFARLGAQVTIIEQRAQLLPQEDRDACALLHQQMRSDGIDLLLGMRACEIRVEGQRKTVVYSATDGSGPTAATVDFDQLLVAAGRLPNVEGLGLERLRIPQNPTATIQVNEYLQTNYPHIYACGDVAGPYQYTHLAMQQAWCATVNALYGFRRLKVDYAVVPWSTFTDPEVARVGLNESDARAQAIPYEVTCIDFAKLDRALADQQAPGLVKVLTVPERDKILGVTIVGPHASELIAEFVLAMNHGLGLRKILTTMHVYPTFTEISRRAADAWQKDHFSSRTLAWLERLHRWRRA